MKDKNKDSKALWSTQNLFTQSMVKIDSMKTLLS